MRKRITVELSESSITNAIKELERLQQKAEVRRKLDEVCKRVAELGRASMQSGYSLAEYDGVKDVSVTVVPIENGYKIIANGESVLFLEFGAGMTYGHGHPNAKDYGMGAGTYPGKGHWNNPNGWWIPKDRVPEGGKRKTLGNAPSMSAYKAKKEMVEAIARIAREVFSEK